MASYGVIGAIGGAAQGFNSALQSQLEEARQMRLEQVRTRNNQETNRLNNEQRAEISLTELKARGEQQESLLGKSDELARGRLEFERSLPPTETWEDAEMGGIPGQRNSQTNKFDPLPVSAADKPPAAAQMHQYWMSDAGGNLSPEEARALVVKQGETEETYRRRIVQELAGSSFDGTVDEQAVENAVRIAFPEPPKPAPSFKTREEALSAAKTRYPQADEATLLERLQAAYPHLFEEQ